MSHLNLGCNHVSNHLPLQKMPQAELALFKEFTSKYLFPQNKTRSI